MNDSDPFFLVFGVSWKAAVAYGALHAHLALFGRKLAKVEATPTVKRELVQLSKQTHSNR